MSDILPGTVFVVSTGNSWAAKLIKIGAVLSGEPSNDNHVAVMSHYTDGVPWGLEGRPGGVGWVDMRNYLRSDLTVSNETQPIDAAESVDIAKNMVALIGTQYDWQAIFADAFASIHVKDWLAQNWHGKGAPGHVVCSSYAAYLYEKAGLPHPALGKERFCTPADWSEFIITKGWQK